MQFFFEYGRPFPPVVLLPVLGLPPRLADVLTRDGRDGDPPRALELVLARLQGAGPGLDALHAGPDALLHVAVVGAARGAELAAGQLGCRRRTRCRR